MKKIMTLLIAMIAMFGLNSCDVFNEVKGSPMIEFGWDLGNGKIGKEFQLELFEGDAATLWAEMQKAIKSEGFIEAGNDNQYVTYDTYTDAEAKSIAKRIVKKVNIEQYKIEINKDFVVRYKIDGETFTEVYRKNLKK